MSGPPARSEAGFLGEINARVMLQSDRSFLPVRDGGSDRRVLAFMVDVERED
ncbi:MAG TPA: hypothetical protein VIC35_07725 [Acidimicrobiia bacterium]